MDDSMLILLLLLQLKHWYIDFVDQSQIEIDSKQHYGQWRGVMHSTKHAVGTALCMGCVLGPMYWPLTLIMGILDGIIHYHIDWIRQRWNERNHRDPGFWPHLGMDQMAHQITYIFFIWIITV